jgi:hypothetical protein
MRDWVTWQWLDKTGDSVKDTHASVTDVKLAFEWLCESSSKRPYVAGRGPTMPSGPAPPVARRADGSLRPKVANAFSQQRALAAVIYSWGIQEIAFVIGIAMRVFLQSSS